MPSLRAGRWSRGSFLPSGGAARLAAFRLGGGFRVPQVRLTRRRWLSGRRGVRLAGGARSAQIWALPIWTGADRRFGARRRGFLMVWRGGCGCNGDGSSDRSVVAWLLGLSGPVGVRPALCRPRKSLSLRPVGSTRRWRLSPHVGHVAVAPEPGISSSSIQVSC
ncbi:hypothetical protein ZWY2020_029965 [Hordeum vulgare]|nr:hypothetical protein ZWY2020_029965 [Hordeum vulgare]